MSSRSTSSVDRDDEEMNKLSQRNKELMQELNALKSKNKQLTRDNDELQNLLDDEKSQCAAFEIEVIALKEELARSQTNEQLLRDERRFAGAIERDQHSESQQDAIYRQQSDEAHLDHSLDVETQQYQQ